MRWVVPHLLTALFTPARLRLIFNMHHTNWQVIIWVELTPEQRAYYKAIYERQIGTVSRSVLGSQVPVLQGHL